MPGKVRWQGLNDPRRAGELYAERWHTGEPVCFGHLDEPDTSKLSASRHQLRVFKFSTINSHPSKVTNKQIGFPLITPTFCSVTCIFPNKYFLFTIFPFVKTNSHLMLIFDRNKLDI